MVIADDVAADFADAFGMYCSGDVATKLACSEVDALAAMLTAIGREDLAAVWIEDHAEDDEEGDAHYRPPL
ncbi:hypothetical protein DP939_02455 [Spongiactinospora rosea]|uniref:Uncharacterized protein n=1 Tax=Spongiactinospora rosea TaxID=2248750 RepID=A0A366M805_9ACTN|nr:hypothetical protein [Spongiactinospora rosea]RBQ21592.1 hypothetical protein DP939_02455 [Spongiactinospora rosea]